MKKLLAYLSVLSIIILSGCGYKSGVTTEEEKAYLYFSGSMDNVSVSVDNGPAFTVKNGKENQYKIKPGKHVVKVFRGKELVVEREVYIGDGISKEIEVR